MKTLSNSVNENIRYMGGGRAELSALGFPCYPMAFSAFRLLEARGLLVHSKTIASDNDKNVRSHTEVGNGCCSGA